MADTNEMAEKFTVWKNEDIESYLTEQQKNNLVIYGGIIMMGRILAGKEKGENGYFVINTDESYAGEVIEILKKNGHWG